MIDDGILYAQTGHTRHVEVKVVSLSLHVWHRPIAPGKYHSLSPFLGVN